MRTSSSPVFSSLSQRFWRSPATLPTRSLQTSTQVDGLPDFNRQANGFHDRRYRIRVVTCLRDDLKLSRSPSVELCRYGFMPLTDAGG